LSLLVMTRINGVLALTRSSSGLKRCWSSVSASSGGVSAADTSVALQAMDRRTTWSSQIIRRTAHLLSTWSRSDELGFTMSWTIYDFENHFQDKFSFETLCDRGGCRRALR